MLTDLVKLIHSIQFKRCLYEGGRLFGSEIEDVSIVLYQGRRVIGPSVSQRYM